MAGQTPDRTDVTPPGDPQEALRQTRRRLAMVQLAVGGPTFLLLIFGLVVAYRVVGRPLGDAVFWFVLGTLLLGFVVYVASALLLIRRSRR